VVGEVITYARVSEGIVKTLRVMGEACPVDGAGAEVMWIGSTDAEASLNWLESVARNGRRDARDSALYITALHESPQATQILHEIAMDTDSELSEEAIFWLGEARGDEGVKALEALLDELPKGDTRRHINFALAQNGTTEALARLVEISRNDPDPEQRGNALFWMAEEHPEQAAELLKVVLADENNEEVLNQAIFAVSQLPGSQGTQMLLELAQSPDQPREIRRLALFWLANSDDDEALAALEALLTH
jgi:HEAT repeat protein